MTTQQCKSNKNIYVSVTLHFESFNVISNVKASAKVVLIFTYLMVGHGKPFIAIH